MIGYLNSAGFLFKRATIGADLSLVIIIAAFVTLTVGVALARSGRYRAHRWVQTAAVALNAVPVVFWMIRSFWLFLRPGLPGNLSKTIDLVSAIHATVGLIGVALGLFVMIRANQLEARGESLSRYKTPMRIAYIVYLLATALGIWVYIALYR